MVYVAPPRVRQGCNPTWTACEDPATRCEGSGEALKLKPPDGSGNVACTQQEFLELLPVACSQWRAKNLDQTPAQLTGFFFLTRFTVDGVTTSQQEVGFMNCP